MVEIKRTLRHSFWICWKDLLEFSRSKLRVVMLVLMPLLMMVLIGFIFPSNSSLNNVPVAVANLDKGSYGNIFVTQLEQINNQTGIMDLKNATDFDDIKMQIQEGKIHGGIIISENFTADLDAGRQGNIMIITDQTNPQMSLMMQESLSKTIAELGVQHAIVNLNVSYELIVPYNVQIGGIVPGEPSYFQFMAPGIMAMVVMMALMTGLPHAISYEKDIGTLDGMLVAPINRFSIILGKTLAQTIRGMIQGVIILLLAIFLFSVVIYGSILLVFLIMFLCVFSFVGLGILITSFTDNEQTASMIMMTLMFPMMFFSGVFFPIEQMPGFMQAIANILPLTYATKALRKVIVLGADLPAISVELIFLVVFGLVLLLIAIPMFKKAMSR
ncbi:MAG: ABC transporter permease [Promethearchaeota archaeon]